MKKFIQKLLIIIVPILSILIGVNYFGDAAHLFDNNRMIKEMAGIIINGKYVTNFLNYDERIFQREITKKFKNSPDILIIGSSRTMLIGSNYFENQSVFNSSVSGATIEDLIAVYQLYKSKKILPKKMIIGIDPWTFNENNGQTRWQSIKNEFESFLNKKETIETNPTINSDQYMELLSPSYFQSSLKYILGNGKPKPTTEKYNKGQTMLTDGSFIYSKISREMSNSEVETEAKKYIIGNIYGIEQFDILSPKKIELFNLFIDDLKEHKIEVAFFLVPYHPTVYQIIKKRYPMVIKAEDYVFEYSKMNNLKAYGSFNPQQLGLNGVHFYDGMHCKETAIKIIFNTEK